MFYYIYMKFRPTEFKILMNAANGKSQRAVMEDAGLVPVVGYPAIKRLFKDKVLEFKKVGVSKELEKVTLFHRNVGNIMVDLLENENRFFKELGKGNVIKEYFPLVLSSLIYDVLDSFFVNRYNLSLEESEKIADIIKAAIFIQIRKEGNEKEHKKVMDFIRASKPPKEKMREVIKNDLMAFINK